MARGSTRRSYVRDGRGRFASTGTTGARAKPAARRAQRGTNRLTRDNSGKITSVGKNGATARGGRLRTAAGNQRGAVLDRLKRAPMAGTVGRGGKVRGGVRVTAVAKQPATIGKPIGGASKRIKGGAMKNTMKPPVTLGGLLAAGGKRWQKNNMDRVYFNNLSEKAGLSVDRYKSGFISSASLRGKGVSNSKAGEIASSLSASKVFYDRGTRRMVVQAPSMSTGRSSQMRTAAELAQGVAGRIRRQARMKPTRRANQGGAPRPAAKPVAPKQANAATVARRPAKTRQDKAAQAMRLASRAAARSQSPKLSKAAALRSEKLSANLRSRAKQLSQRPTLSRAQRDKAARARKDYGVKSTGTKGRKGAAASGAVPTGRTVYRTRAQASRAQRARTNALGKATAAKRGFNGVSAANFRARIAGRRGDQQMFADSAPRTVISRPRIPQISLSGRVERVGAGRFRTVGERLGGGSIRRPRSKPGPMRGTKAWKRQLEQLIKANGGKDVAAFRF